MRVVFAPEAEADPYEIVEYAAKQNPGAAIERGERILSMIERLANGDLDGPERRLISGEFVRSWAVPPVQVYYKRVSGMFWVVRIYHQARRPIVR